MSGLRRVAILIGTPIPINFQLTCLINEGRELQGLFQEAITRQALKRHREHAGVQYSDGRDSKSLRDLPGLRPQRVAEFQFFPSQIVLDGVGRDQDGLHHLPSRIDLTLDLLSVFAQAGDDGEDQHWIALGQDRVSREDQDQDSDQDHRHSGGPRLTACRPGTMVPSRTSRHHRISSMPEGIGQFKQASVTREEVTIRP